MSATIQLTNAEIKLIELKREQEANKAEAERIAAEKIIAEEKQREAEHVRKLTKQQIAMVDCAAELIQADKSQLLTIDWKIDRRTGVDLPTFSFIAGRKYTIDIGEHIVYGSSSYRGTSKGLKFSMPKGLDDYGTKWVKSPATVLKNVKEMIDIHNVRTAREQEKKAVASTTMDQLTELFPTLEVKYLKAGEYGSDKYMDTWTVSSSKGMVVYAIKDGAPVAIRVAPSAEILDEVLALITE